MKWKGLLLLAVALFVSACCCEDEGNDELRTRVEVLHQNAIDTYQWTQEVNQALGVHRQFIDDLIVIVNKLCEKHPDITECIGPVTTPPPPSGKPPAYP